MKYILYKLITFGCLFLYLLSCTETTENEVQNVMDGQAKISISDSLAIDPLNFIDYSAEAGTGETVYVPVYSHIYQQSAQRTFNLTATLSIRNTDLRRTITVSKVYYYDSKGDLVQEYLNESRQIGPLSSISFVVEEEDLRGGVGANFLVLWEAKEHVTQPIIEAVMISTAQSQGISFISEGRIIHSLQEAPTK